MHLFLDLDGTLCDPAVGFVGSVRHAFERLGLPAPPAGQIARHIGPPLHETMEALLGGPAQVPRAVQFYRERYATVGIREVTWYPGIAGALQRLARANTLYVVTSKPTVFAREIVAASPVPDCFRAVHGSDLSGALADKRRLIAHVLTVEALEPGAAAMIGDRAQDMAGALHNNVGGYGVAWGYGSREELLQAGALRVYATPADLAGCFSQA